MQNLPQTAAGPYPGPGQTILMRDNTQQWLLQAQSLPAGKTVAANGGNPSASIAVQLERVRGTSYPFGASFEISFSGAPGTFEVDIQTADQDQDASFVTISSLTGGTNASNVGRVELPTFWARYVRAYVKTLTNAVNVSVLVTR